MNRGRFVKGEKRPGQGRPKGSVDKGTRLIREMVAMALDQAGGIEYLARMAEEHPGPFLTLVGKAMPVQVEGSGGGPVQTALRIEYVRPQAVEHVPDADPAA